MIKMLKDEVPISFLCQYFGCSRSAFYAWLGRVNNIKKNDNERRFAVIEAFKEFKGRYGSPRIFKVLKKRNIKICENTVAKIMRKEGLIARKKKRFKVNIIKEDQTEVVADRVFKIEENKIFSKNELWVGDITYIPFDNKFLYLSVVLDVARRKVVGWSIDNTLSSEGVIKAFQQAFEAEGEACEIFHSDQGVQYKSSIFRKTLKEMNVIPSMSRKGNCYDNAYIETFFKSLKSELLWNDYFISEEDLKFKIFKYIEIFYNKKRLHSALDYKSPMEYELESLAA